MKEATKSTASKRQADIAYGIADKNSEKINKKFKHSLNLKKLNLLGTLI